MKTITFKNENGKVVADTGEETAGMPTQQVTIAHYTPLRNDWVRQIQVSGEFIFCKRYGCPTVGMHVDDFIALAVAAEPKLSWPPLFNKFPKSAILAAGAPVTLEVFAVSELPMTFQWQVSTDRVEFSDIPGSTTFTLSVNSPGQYRCVATNAAGSTSTAPAIITAV